MLKTDLGDLCGRFLTSHFSSKKSSLNNEHIANNHKSHTILNQKLLFKPYKKNPLEQLRKRYTNLLPITTNDLVLTTCSSLEKQSSIVTEKKKSSSSLMMNWEMIKDRGSGLINLGNTCFINASLQCLANTPPLVQWLLSNSHHQACRMKLENKFCLFCEAERIIKLIHSKKTFSSSNAPANPNNLVRRIKEISKTFRFGRQEDASEFLICLIDKIVEACLRSSSTPERLRPSSGSSYEQLCHSQTILHDLFALVLRSRVICSRCRYTSDTFEVQYTWIVGVRNQSDLRQSLQQFVCRESLTGENLYRCMKCKQLVPAVKRYTLHKASKILLINLKRFEFGKNSHKLSHLVRYPEYLNVKPYMSEENSTGQSLNYRLYAVLVHVGSSMHSGHYYSYVRSPNNRWYKADDTSMIQCDVNQVLTQHGAYILCYIQEADSKETHHIPNGISEQKSVHQNGKIDTSKFFTSKPISITNLPRQINGHVKTINGNGISKPVDVPSKSNITNGYSSSDEPVKKKARFDESSSTSSLTSSSSLDEQSVPSNTFEQKKKKKKKFLENGHGLIPNGSILSSRDSV